MSKVLHMTGHINDGYAWNIGTKEHFAERELTITILATLIPAIYAIKWS